MIKYGVTRKLKPNIIASIRFTREQYIELEVEDIVNIVNQLLEKHNSSIRVKVESGKIEAFSIKKIEGVETVDAVENKDGSVSILYIVSKYTYILTDSWF